MSTKTNGKPRRLGRGLSSLMGPAPVPVAAPEAPSDEGSAAEPRQSGDATPPGAGGGAEAAPTGDATPDQQPKPDQGSDSGPGRNSGRASPATPAAPSRGSPPQHAGGESGQAGDAHRQGSDSEPAGLRRLPVDSIDPSPFQPRQVFDEGALRQLADSISRSGMMQPIVVRPGPAHARGSGGATGSARYELVAGERRLRAAKLAGLADVPAIVREIEDEGAAELALVENLQREDLSAIERAKAMKALSERFDLTHAQVAERVGLERSSVTNLVRLLELEDEIIELLAQDMLQLGHGKALLSAPAGSKRVGLAARAVREDWSVRRLEQEARGSGGDGGSSGGAPGKAKGEGGDRPASLSELERQLSEHLGTKVRITANAKGDRGRLTVEFYSLDHFDGLMGKMGFGMEG